MPTTERISIRCRFPSGRFVVKDKPFHWRAERPEETDMSLTLVFVTAVPGDFMSSPRNPFMLTAVTDVPGFVAKADAAWPAAPKTTKVHE